MNNSDLHRPFFLPNMRGWVTVPDGLKLVCGHDWSEFTRLRNAFLALPEVRMLA